MYHVAVEAATLAQRRRSAALVGVVIALVAIGFASRVPSSGHAPAPCAQPALRDGVLVCDGSGAPAGSRSWLVGGKLDVNTATQAQLEEIPGVGPSLARAILDERAKRGRFARFDDLDDVPGIGPKTLGKLAPFVDAR
jgi:competence protein ComEA